MTEIGMIQILLYLIALLAMIKPLGTYMALVYEGKLNGVATLLLAPLENGIYRLCNVRKDQEMDWKGYLISMLLLNLVGVLAVYAIQRLQVFLPLNPQHFGAISPDLSFNTATSFTSNTNWQAYSGESSLSYLTQMIGLTVQNFLSAATGMSLVVAFIRGFKRHEVTSLGNFWVDMTRSIVYILLPLSLVFAVFLTSQGVIQNFSAYQRVSLVQPIAYQQQVATTAPAAKTITVTEQLIPMGPVASQVAIKQLGTNGGGFFNTNAAHPFENPTPLTNFFEMLAILLIPAAFCYTFGLMVEDKRQGFALLAAMFIIFMPLAIGCITVEQNGNNALAKVGIEQQYKRDLFPGGNLEGKETRVGVVGSALWTAVTTATCNGSVNSMLDSYIPISGFVPLWLMHLGEVIFGGVGSGLYGMLSFVILTVFVAGLMIGRTPEYLGKKIEPFEIKMASISVLIMPLTVLICTAVAVVTKVGTDAISNPGIHGFTQVFYAFTSMANNNGSAFAGLNANTDFYNILGGIVMLIGRYWFVIPILAIAGSLVRKKVIPKSSGTLPTHTPLFVIILASIIIILGSLSFLPAIALGPVVEQFALWEQYGK